ncbi:MAG: hypothetical protein ACRD3R_14575 [Terriglobales bacterium]
MEETMKCIWMLVLLVAVTSSAYAQDKPNIVFIFADNLGYGEVGACGGGILRRAATTRIGSLAAVVAGVEQRHGDGI